MSQKKDKEIRRQAIRYIRGQYFEIRDTVNSFGFFKRLWIAIKIVFGRW